MEVLSYGWDVCLKSSDVYALAFKTARRAVNFGFLLQSWY